MGILLKNATIISFSPSLPEIFEGDILVIDNKIKNIGKCLSPINHQVIDCRGMVVIPGLKNAHAHASLEFAKGLFSGLDLQTWLYKKIFPMEAHLEKNDEYKLSRLGILEMISSGITSCFDMYFTPSEMKKACDELGFRCRVLSTISSSPDCLDKLKNEMLNTNSEKGLVSYYLGYHSDYTTNDEVMKGLGKLANELKTPIWGHNSETELEVDNCLKKRNLTPTEYADSLGFFEYGGGGYHCIYLSENDIDIFKKKNLYIVTCPRSNAYLSDGICPIDYYKEKGLNIALGTDGQSSNYSLDILKEICLLVDNNKTVSYKEGLTFATVNGAFAMGQDNTSCLEPDYLADLIVLKDVDLSSIYKSICQLDIHKSLYLTMIDGKILYFNGQFTYDKNYLDVVFKEGKEVISRLQNYIEE